MTTTAEKCHCTTLRNAELIQVIKVVLFSSQLDVFENCWLLH